ncbi:hypothetical protein KFK09_007036 [Dendrobium nobile]|uniref:Uncharacterized protein n=1 Tax=Dendrobium nobile TaxID=94219 RepID=A0A8T3BQT7_DENNO|nr:hypothetical protein KFK09_007036 [Dendrobium nobile]
MGGVWIKWNSSSIFFRPTFISSKLIHGSVSYNSVIFFEFSMLYDSNALEERRFLWDEIKTLAINIKSPWILLGDHNFYSFFHDKVGGNPLQNSRLLELNGMSFEIGLNDLGLVGHINTWFNPCTYNPIHINLGVNTH